MEQTRVWITVAGLLLVVGMAGLGYWLGVRVEQRVTPATTVTSSPVPAVAIPSPTPTVQAAATALPPNQREIVGRPTETAAPTAPPTAGTSPTIILEDTPPFVRLGTPLRVRWQILGGSTAEQGTSTRLLVSGAGMPEHVGPSFGAYVFPARFEAIVTLQKRGSFLLVAEAVVGGQNLPTGKQALRAERLVTVE